MLSDTEREKGSAEGGERGTVMSCLAAHKWEINTPASLMLPRVLCLLAGNFNDVSLSRWGA